MLELSMLDGFAVDVLQLVAWANVGVAVALLLAVVFWLVCCGFESRQDRRGARTL